MVGMTVGIEAMPEVGERRIPVAVIESIFTPGKRGRSDSSERCREDHSKVNSANEAGELSKCFAKIIATEREKKRITSGHCRN